MAKWKEPEYFGTAQPAVDKIVFKEDVVNKPKHYGQGRIECIEYLEDFLSYEEYVGYLRGNIAKYMHRWRYKNGIEDLRKAEWYGARLINLVEGTKLEP